MPRLSFGGRKFAAVDKNLADAANHLSLARYPSYSGQVIGTVGPLGSHVHVPQTAILVAVSTSTITARSGSTAGSGTADFKLFNPPTFSSDASRTGITVYNFSSATGGIASGKYIMCTKWYNEWFVFAAEC
jgi:predicted amidohydrolase